MQVKHIVLCVSGAGPISDNLLDDDEDVRAEEALVKRQVSGNETEPDVAVQIRGLAKTYPGTLDIGFCKLHKSPPYHAVKV